MSIAELLAEQSRPFAVAALSLPADAGALGGMRSRFAATALSLPPYVGEG